MDILIRFTRLISLLTTDKCAAIIISAACLLILSPNSNSATIWIGVHAGNDSKNLSIPDANTSNVLSSIANTSDPNGDGYSASASARVVFGKLGVSASANTKQGGNGVGQVSARATATAAISDKISVENPNGSEAFIRFEFNLTGGLTLNSPFDDFTFGEYARMRFSIKDVGSGTGRGQTYLDYKEEITYAGSTQSGTLIAEIDILDGGYIHPLISLGADVTCGAPTSSPQNNCLAAADFFNSVTIIGAEVLDSNRIVIQDVILQSESGFDYQKGYLSPVDISPWKNPAGPNLGLDPDITLSGPAQDGKPVQVSFQIHNYGDEPVTSTVNNPIQAKLTGSNSENLITGNEFDTKSLSDGTSIAEGASAALTFTWTPRLAQNISGISVDVNPAFTVNDNNFDNNETTLAVTVEDPFIPPAIDVLSCTGFGAPFEGPITINKKAKGTIPVKIQLTDANGYNVSDVDINTAPVINVLFNGFVYGDSTTDDAALESVGSSNDGNQFSYNNDIESWEFRLSTKQFSGPGTYSVSVRSGDSGEYTVSATGGQCVQTFARQP